MSIAAGRRRGIIEPSQMKACIAVDLGTTNSVVSVIDCTTATPRTVSFEGNHLLPSVAFYDGDKVIVGKNAAALIGRNQNVIKSSKRIIGRRFNEPAVAVAVDACNAKVVPGHDGFAEFEVQGRRISPKRVATDILKHMLDAVDELVNKKIRNLVITVPAHFTQYQMAQTEEAARSAGFTEVRVISEPVAAGYSYGYGQTEEYAGTILVYDLGGGTFDVSILKCEEKVFDMVAWGGDNDLGGDDVDMKLANWVEKKYRQMGTPLIPSGNSPKVPIMRSNLIRLCRLAKEQLFVSKSVSFDPSEVNCDVEEEIKITSDTLDTLVEGLVDRTKEKVKQVLREANMTTHDIEKVIMVGGSSKLRAVNEMVVGMFGSDKIENRVNRDEIVSHGACLHGAQERLGPRTVLKAVQSVGVKVIIDRKREMFSPIIEKGTVLPVTKTEVYSTIRNKQDKVEIDVYQGVDVDNIQGNLLLGTYQAPLKHKAKAGAVDVVIEMEMEASGLLYVTTRERYEGSEQVIRNREMFRANV